jgi:hypothetical protein
MSQQARRHDPYPWTWEVPVGVMLVILLVLVCGVHLGRAIASVLVGAGWVFPGRIEFFTSLPEVLRGDAGAGLTGLNEVLPSPMVLWVCVVATELMLIVVCGFVLKLVLKRRGPSRMQAWRRRVRPKGCSASPGSARTAGSSGQTSTGSADTGHEDDLQSGRGGLAARPGP